MILDEINNACSAGHISVENDRTGHLQLKKMSGKRVDKVRLLKTTGSASNYHHYIIHNLLTTDALVYMYILGI